MPTDNWTTGYATTSASTWQAWTSITSSATTSITASPWVHWASNYTASTTATYANTIAATNTTWSLWSSGVQTYRPAYVSPPPPETEEQRAARRERAAAYEAREQIRKAARRVAISKADALLESLLDDMQRAQLAQDSAFLLRSQSGKIYRLRKGRSGNVDEIDAEGRVVAVYCAHPALDVPDGDTVVAQKLMLEADEAAFLKIANRHTTYGRPPVNREALEALLHAP